MSEYSNVRTHSTILNAWNLQNISRLGHTIYKNTHLRVSLLQGCILTMTASQSLLTGGLPLALLINDLVCSAVV